MHRVRTLAGSPFRSAADAWEAAKDLIIVTLERSARIAEGTVAAELRAADGVGVMLTASGHLDRRPLTLVDGTLHADIHIVTGDSSFTVDETTTPIPGGANATSAWKLYIDAPSHLQAMVAAACADSDHLVPSKAPAPVETESSSSTAWSIDSDALRRLGGSA